MSDETNPPRRRRFGFAALVAAALVGLAGGGFATAAFGNNMAAAEKWAARIQIPAYAIDEETAIKVVDGAVEVVSEGHWKLFASETKR
jgi:hypothetical protein